MDKTIDIISTEKNSIPQSIVDENTIIFFKQHFQNKI